MATSVKMAPLKFETWHEMKELPVGMRRGIIAKEPDFPDEWYQERFAVFQTNRRADRDGHSETSQEG